MKNTNTKSLENKLLQVMHDTASKVSDALHADPAMQVGKGAVGKLDAENALYDALGPAIRKTIIDEISSQYGLIIDLKYNSQTRKLESAGYKLQEHTDLGAADVSHPTINDLIFDLEARRKKEVDPKHQEVLEEQIARISSTLSETNKLKKNFKKIDDLVSSRLEETNNALKTDVENFADKISKGEKIEKPNKRNIPLTVLKIVGVIASVALVAVAVYALNIYVAKGSAEVQAVKNIAKTEPIISAKRHGHGHHHGRNHHHHGHHGHHGRGHHYGWASAPEAIVETVETVATVASAVGFNTNMITIPLTAVSILSIGIYHNDTISAAAVDASRKAASAMSSAASSIKNSIIGISSSNEAANGLKSIGDKVADSTQELSDTVKDTFKQHIQATTAAVSSKAEESALNKDSREARKSFNDLPSNMDEYLMRFATHEERKQYLENDRTRAESGISIS